MLRTRILRRLILSLILSSPPFAQATPSPPASQPARQVPPSSPSSSHRPLALADAPQLELQTINALLTSDRWVKRCVVALRLQRYSCARSADLLLKLLADPSPYVRAFALRSLAVRITPQDPRWFLDEHDPLVIRTLLRLGYTIDSARIIRGSRSLMRMDDLREKLLGVEISAASSIPELLPPATLSARTIILRMDRAQAGSLSPRLSALTSAPSMHRPSEWHAWLLKTGRAFKLNTGPAPSLSASSPLDDPIAALSAEDFAGLETYMQSLGRSPLDLAICIDTTASMYSVLAQAQSGIDDLMLFARSVASDTRLAFVAYRDRRDRYQTRAFDFTHDLDLARTQLWSLDADGGGDSPESVFNALQIALTSLAWREDSRKVLILLGDAPPHVGQGELAVDLARRAKTQFLLTTHSISAKGTPVKHFDQIAAAGGGRNVNLADDSALIPEIVGLTLADRYESQFRHLFFLFLQLCR